MSLLDIISKVGNLVTSPMGAIGDVVNDWATEPLKKWENDRNEKGKDNDVRRKIELDTAMMNAESKIRRNEDQLKTDLIIKKETHIKKILIELEEWQKDEQLKRMKNVSNAVKEYHEKLTKINISAIAAIGNMELSLRSRAHDLILDKTEKYGVLRDAGLQQAMSDSLEIEKKFAGNERVKEMLTKAVEDRLTNIIRSAGDFITELKSDISMLNTNIDILTKNGQRFIENHLAQFQTLTPVEIVKSIEDNHKN